MQLSDYHAKYFAHDLTLKSVEGVGRLSRALFDAQVDLNPHQIEAALFALNSPLSKGVILSDEVGLGKTIEAGIILCQLWAERKRRILVIGPAAIRKQWALEMEEKFNLPARVLDAKGYKQLQKAGNPRPFDLKELVVVSFHFANRYKEEIRSIPWDMVVIDEAHKLRNAYRPSNKLGQGIRWAVEERKKILLTATPLQNSLLELYGLSTFIDDLIFGDPAAFRSQYMNAGADIEELRGRLRGFCKRTLRKDVTEYVSYTKRRPITRPFNPTDDEQKLYEAVSAFLQREDSYAIPKQRRHLTVLILRKLLASSVDAIAGTLETMKARLVDLRDGKIEAMSLPEQLIEDEEMEDDLLDEVIDEIESESDELDLPRLDIQRLTEEIAELDNLVKWAGSIGTETKTKTLIQALEAGFKNMSEMGAAEKALIFTESRRTQEALKRFLDANGYAGRVVLFNGTNSGPEAKAIYEAWIEKNRDTGRSSGSRAIDARTALIEHFRDTASILIATEAAAEGVNMQFCSLVVNYDLPWNPQRIEQRIGRCHRYGQKHDVVVINFINNRNEADQRVHQLLQDKFLLFDGVFGASDDVLGSIESGVDFEKRILAIYQDYRTPAEIEDAFNKLREELDESIQNRMADTQKALLEHFDEDVHARLKMELADTQSRLDIVSRRFWGLSRHVIADRADWFEDAHSFQLNNPPAAGVEAGHYYLISKNKRLKDRVPEEHGHFLYRMGHPLGEWATDTAKSLETPFTEITFDITNHPTRLTLVDALKGTSGVLRLTRLKIQSYEEEEYLLFSAFDDSGKSLDQETCEKLFSVAGASSSENTRNNSLVTNQSSGAGSSGHFTAPDWASLKIRAGENLPHWTCEHAIYHVSFRLFDSLPASKLEAWRQERTQLEAAATAKDGALSEAEAQRIHNLFSEKVETFLDSGIGECWLRDFAIAGIVSDALHHFDGERYRLHAFCIMPNHVHVLVETLTAAFPLEKIVHSWKSFTSNRINQVLRRTGQVWQHEPFDHIVRDEAEYKKQFAYILNNPRKAGICAPTWPELPAPDNSQKEEPEQDAPATIPPEQLHRLAQEAQRYVEATISRSLDANSQHFSQARERLERWAEDSVLAAEQAIKDTKEQIKALRRQSRQAETLTEQKELQEKIQSLEKKQRRQRQQIFDVEDEINDKRDALITELERRLSQKTESTELFTIRWQVV
ncbi:MAG: ATP-dependent helicase [Puniceicoccaceae bacterium]|nr:MAG: ATP-dependent helicase [Puniceicoccaceae bacterium]